MKFNKEIIEHIERNLGLSFIDDKYVDGEVCFANSSEVRTEFRQSFSAQDIVNYIQAIEHKMNDKAIVQIPYPKGLDAFWKLVEEGAKMETNKRIEQYQKMEWY